ncbi:hypothetical protein, partial [Enterobacter cloacae complex sp. ESBL7]|uniref:hypothetical protein n=1 Tax=Enterobacter cloacae complex sp. ESBL7 TaxID=3163325 RepID=UPI00356186E4
SSGRFSLPPASPAAYDARATAFTQAGPGENNSSISSFTCNFSALTATTDSPAPDPGVQKPASAAAPD